MNPIDKFAVFTSDVAFRKASHADGETVLFTNELNELAGEFESAGRNPKFGAGRRVAAQGEHVFDTEAANFIQQITDLLASGVDASQVGDGGQAMLLLDAINDHQRFF